VRRTLNTVVVMTAIVAVSAGAVACGARTPRRVMAEVNGCSRTSLQRLANDSRLDSATRARLLDLAIRVPNAANQTLSECEDMKAKTSPARWASTIRTIVEQLSPGTPPAVGTTSARRENVAGCGGGVRAFANQKTTPTVERSAALTLLQALDRYPVSAKIACTSIPFHVIGRRRQVPATDPNCLAALGFAGLLAQAASSVTVRQAAAHLVKVMNSAPPHGAPPCRRSHPGR
jgi:hypothetical protein